MHRKGKKKGGSGGGRLREKAEREKADREKAERYSFMLKK